MQYISKGNEHKKYEFGNKVSILYTQNTRVIVAAASYHNTHDDQTLNSGIEQYQRLLGRPLKTVAADRGYKGKAKIENTLIQIPKPFNSKTINSYQQRKIRRQFKRRAVIEAIIGHLKSDHRLGRKFYRRIVGDCINILLAAAFNFKRMMNIYKKILAHIIKIIQASIFREYSKLCVNGQLHD